MISLFAPLNVSRLFLLFFLSLTSTGLLAETNDNFDYAASVALILKVEDGGHVFQRPDRENPLNSFIQSMVIINKYAAQMQPAHAGLALDIKSLQPQHSFLLINHQATKLFFLGDHWLGDENAFAVMETNDYQALKHIFDWRKKNTESTITPKNVQDIYIREIHKLWQEDSEEFFRRFYFPEQGASKSVSSASLNNSSVPAKNIAQQNSSVINSSKATYKANDDLADSTHATSSTTITAKPHTVIPAVTDTKADKAKSLSQTLALFFILTLTVAYWWWRQRK